MISGFLFALCMAMSGASAAGSNDPAWLPIQDDEGIQVWRQSVPDTSLVRFRSRGVVEAPIDRVTAVMVDRNRYCEWTHACAECFDLESHGAVAVTYNRTYSPVFFVSDRDVVIETQVSLLSERKAVRGNFREVVDPRKPPVAHAVRLIDLQGYYELRQIDAASTEVLYEVLADPGGNLPKWLVNWAAKDLPFETLRALRLQVHKSGYEPTVARLHRLFDWTGFDVR